LYDFSILYAFVGGRVGIFTTEYTEFHRVFFFFMILRTPIFVRLFPSREGTEGCVINVHFIHFVRLITNVGVF
jgi:hypothetical protein